MNVATRFYPKIALLSILLLLLTACAQDVVCGTSTEQMDSGAIRYYVQLPNRRLEVTQGVYKRVSELYRRLGAGQTMVCDFERLPTTHIWDQATCWVQ